MPEWAVIGTVCAIFAFAGIVKGIIGFGLPMVSLGLLSLIYDAPAAISLLLIPALVTNVWQAASGGSALLLWRRLWMFFIAATLMIAIGTAALAYSRFSSILLGSIFIVYAAAGLTGATGMRAAAPARHEKSIAAVIGAVNGFFTGMTGNLAFPGILFLQSIGLSRGEFVQALGILFVLSTAALAAAMHARGLLVTQWNLLSLTAVLPALAGMAAGQKIRRRLPEKHFRQIFYAAITALGVYIIAKNIIGG